MVQLVHLCRSFPPGTKSRAARVTFRRDYGFCSSNNREEEEKGRKVLLSSNSGIAISMV